MQNNNENKKPTEEELQEKLLEENIDINKLFSDLNNKKNRKKRIIRIILLNILFVIINFVVYLSSLGFASNLIIVNKWENILYYALGLTALNFVITLIRPFFILIFLGYPTHMFLIRPVGMLIGILIFNSVNQNILSFDSAFSIILFVLISTIILEIVNIYKAKLIFR